MLLPPPSGEYAEDRSFFKNKEEKMEEKKSGSDKIENLRRLAEEALREKALPFSGNRDGQLPGEEQRLLHELRVHQIELEMQNEELRRAQVELEISRAQYFDLYEMAPVGYVTLDEWGLIRQANLTAARLLGMEKSELLREPLTRFIIREDQDTYYFFRKQLLERPGQKACEMRMIKKNGSRFWALLEMTVLSEGEKKVPVCRAVIMDITDRKQAEEMLKNAHLALEQKVKERTLELEKANEQLQVQVAERNKAALARRKSEEHFRKIVEIMPIAVFGHTEEGIVFANTAAAKLMEVTTPRALLGNTLRDFLPSDEQEIFTRQFREVLAGRAEQKLLITMLVSTTGTLIDVELFLTPFTYQEKPGVHITAYNITERKKGEDKAIKAAKLESISILAGGIAHDFNNYLATMLGNISLARSYTDKQDKVYRYLENMEKATLRVKELTLQLFTFAKGGAPVKKTASIGKLISESTKFALSGSNVDCRLSLPEELYSAEIDEGQISQVLYNIIINAVQAMPEGGSIEVKAENVTIKTERNEHHIPLPEGEYVKISITDEGPGIPEKNLLKIFDPFFSTKPEGSGLGLASAYSIIKKHDGYIQAESEKGKGATFIFYLRASLQTVQLDTEKDEIISGTGKVLVMDDEEEIRNVMGEMLSFLGYETHFAKSGEEALKIFQEAQKAGRPFDLVVMDLTIPGGMGGKETIKRMLQEEPALRAIVSSGYSNDPVMAKYEEYGFKGVIRKPYTINNFSRVIYKAINSL